MLDGQKVLITGATGKIAFPIARTLAERNEVWGAARLKEPGRPGQADGGRQSHRSSSTWPAPTCPMLPDDFDYVFHAAVDAGTDDWTRCVETNAHNSGELLAHCRTAKGFVFCSTGSIYGYQGRRPLRETDPPGVPLRPNYSFSKIAAEAVCTWVADHYDIPLTIIRICSTYGPEGGAPADRLDAMLAGKPIRLHPGQAEQLQPDLRRRLRRTRHPGDGGRRHSPGRRQLGGQRDRQRRGLLHVHGRARRRRAHLRVHARRAHSAVARRHSYARGPRVDESAVARGLSAHDRRPPP